MTPLTESEIIARLAAGLPRAPTQLNALHESDAELVRLPGSDMVLAVTTDGLVEEIATGLYRDPELIGWMAVMVNASDLAAVGADPLGLLLSVTVPPAFDGSQVDGLRSGIERATVACGLPLLGGDTNAGATLSLTGTAIGLIPNGASLTRCGCRPGDRLFASGPLGLGSAFALAALTNSPDAGAALGYRPRARLSEGQVLRGRAAACMDTSDGLLATLDELAKRNGCGFRMTAAEDVLFEPRAFATARGAKLPTWFLLAGPHGEFELVFTVRKKAVDGLRTAAAKTGWKPVELGEVVNEPGVRLTVGGREVVLDTGRIRKVFGEVGGDPGRFMRALWEVHGELV